MSKRRRIANARADGTARPGEAAGVEPAAAKPAGVKPAAIEPAAGSAPEARYGRRSSARTRVTAAVLGALVLVAIAGVAWRMWPRPQARTAEMLATLVKDEGPWDNPWDLQPAKIASLQQDVQKTSDPI